jgi:hypothetical protein
MFRLISLLRIVAFFALAWLSGVPARDCGMILG